jgi:hypothetical protein
MARGGGGRGIFTAACSVIRIFTIAAAEPGRDSFGRRNDVTRPHQPARPTPSGWEAGGGRL